MSEQKMNHDEFLWFHSNGAFFIKKIVLVEEPNPSSIFPFVLLTRL